jgi:hypothetical protein
VSFLGYDQVSFIDLNYVMPCLNWGSNVHIINALMKYFYKPLMELVDLKGEFIGLLLGFFH